MGHPAVAGAEPEERPPGREPLERRRQVRDDQRMAGLRVGDGRAEADPAGRLGRQRQGDVRVERQGRRVRQADQVEPELLAEADGRADPLEVACEVQEAEAHAVAP